MHRRLLLAIAATLAATLAVTGCEGMKRQDQASRLDTALRAYTEAVRWGNLEAAALFARPRAGSAPLPAPSDLDGLRVTGYSARVDRVNATADEADVVLTFTYYHEDRGSIRSVEQRAPWYFDAGRETWVMDGPLPQFRH